MKVVTYFLNRHCVKSVGIRSYFGSHIPAFGLNTEITPYSVRMRDEYGHFLHSDIYKATLAWVFCKFAAYLQNTFS